MRELAWLASDYANAGVHKQPAETLAAGLRWTGLGG